MIIKINTKNIEIIDNQEFYFICNSLELLENKIVKIIFEDIDEEAFIIRIKEKLYCYSNECPHNHIRKLEQGFVNNNKITCPMHGWSFDLSTGKCINKSTAKLKRYNVYEIKNKLYIQKPKKEKPKWMK